MSLKNFEIKLLLNIILMSRKTSFCEPPSLSCSSIFFFCLSLFVLHRYVICFISSSIFTHGWKLNWISEINITNWWTVLEASIAKVFRIFSYFFYIFCVIYWNTFLLDSQNKDISITFYRIDWEVLFFLDDLFGNSFQHTYCIWSYLILFGVFQRLCKDYNISFKILP